MATIQDKFDTAFRDYVTAGVPASGKHEPVKSDIRSIAAAIETALAALSGGQVDAIHATRAALLATSPANGATAIVYADPTAAYNDYWVRTGDAWGQTNLIESVVAARAAPYLDEAAASAEIAAAAAESIEGLSAAALAGDEASVLVFAFGSELAERTVLTRNSGTTYTGSLTDFLPSLTWAARSVVDANGTVRTTGAGEAPYDYSSGAKRLKAKGTDSLIITDSEFDFGLATTIVADLIIGGTGAGTLLELTGAGGTNLAAITETGGNLVLFVYNSGTSTSVVLGDMPDAGSRIEAALRLESGIASAAINGEPWRTVSHHSNFASYAVPTSFTPVKLTIANTTDYQFIGRMQLANRTVADNEFQNLWRTYRPVIKATGALGQFRDTFGSDGGGRYREPRLVMFDDGKDSGRVSAVATSGQRYEGVGSVPGEMATRVVGWPVSYTDGADEIDIGARFTLYEPEYWDSGKGHSQSFLGVKCKVGANKARTACFVHDYLGDIAGSDPGDVSTLQGTIRFQWSEKNLSDLDPDGWTNAYQAPVGEYAVPGPGAEVIELPAGHPHAGRLGFPVHRPDGMHLLRRNTDGSFTMSAAAAAAPGGYTPNECAQVLTPNGDILIFCRMELVGDAQNVLGIYRSPAATAFESLTFEALLDTGDGWEGAAVGFSAFQLDPEGRYGPIGRIGIPRALNESAPVRHGNKVSFFEDEDFTLRDEQDILARLQVSGYSYAVPIFGGRQLLFVNETSLDTALNARDSTSISVVELNLRANAL